MLAALLVVFRAPALAQGTPEQREACTPDAFRLCGQFIPDAGKVEMCLRSAGPKLSPACYVVFNPPRQSAPQPNMRARKPPPRWHNDDDDDDDD